jgi:soluble lytic murein transglycosylase-like protein
MARLGFVESTWDEDAISSIGCRGIYQINPVLWEHALYKIDNGRLGNKILNNNLDTKELYHDISYGIELGCFVFAWFLKKENGCYIKAAESFSGFKNKKNNKYKKYIFYLTNDCG